MKIIIEAEISDTEAEKLEEMGYDVNYPFSVNVALDYGDKVIYGNGKITITDMREKVKEYVSELDIEIKRVEGEIVNTDDKYYEARMMSRIDALTEIRNDLLGRLEEVIK